MVFVETSPGSKSRPHSDCPFSCGKVSSQVLFLWILGLLDFFFNIKIKTVNAPKRSVWFPDDCQNHNVAITECITRNARFSKYVSVLSPTHLYVMYMCETGSHGTQADSYEWPWTPDLSPKCWILFIFCHEHLADKWNYGLDTRYATFLGDISAIWFLTQQLPGWGIPYADSVFRITSRQRVLENLRWLCQSRGSVPE